MLGATGVQSTTVCKIFVASASPTTRSSPHLFREVRPFGIYDGSSDVHLWSTARRIPAPAGADVALRGNPNPTLEQNHPSTRLF
jgi:hypothetical protein